MIDWEIYFDRIWCINYIPYSKRRESISREFERIGISRHRNFNWHFTFDSPFYDVGMELIRRNPNVGKLMNSTELKCCNAHYSCIKKSAAFGDRSILIVEDDSRFLNDTSEIKTILDNIPKDYDIILFDYFANISAEEYESYRKRKVNEYFSEYDDLKSTGCYSLNGDAIGRIAKSYEKFILPSDGYNVKGVCDGIEKRYFSIKNLSCQCTYSKSMSFNNAGANTIHRVYERMGIDYSEYNMDDGKPYGYGSYVIEGN